MAVRLLAADIIAENPQDCIEVDGCVLRQFGDEKQDYASKADYVKSIQTQGTWGDDATLNVVLHKLGYQPVIHVPQLLPYVPFEQPNYCRRIDVTCTGNHWMLLEKTDTGQLKAKSNPGNGDCMYHVLAQQFTQDAPVMCVAVTQPTVASKSVAENVVVRAVKRQWQPSNPVVSEVVDAWLASVKQDPQQTFSYLLFYLATGDMSLQQPAHVAIFAQTIAGMSPSVARVCLERAMDSSSSMNSTEAGAYLMEQLLQRIHLGASMVSSHGLFKPCGVQALQEEQPTMGLPQP
jgi:hypothetical protein